MKLTENQCSVGVISNDETYVGYGNEGININYDCIFILNIRNNN